jgi:hypothetical protein
MNEITKLEKTIFTVLMTISLALIFSISGSVSTYAQVTSNTTATTGTTLTLGEPFYVEHYQAVVEKPEITNMSSTDSFAGKGILNGTLAISVEGNATETLRNNETSYLQGTATFLTDNGDVASYNFEAIGKYNPDGTFESRGAAVFNDSATGELSPLSNTIAIYQDRIDSNGNGTFLMWHWK